MASVQLKGVKKVFGGSVTAVHELTFSIRDKEFVVLVGPSGCGKSTTLRMIAGLEEVTEGTIAIDGIVVNDIPPKDRDIAMVFQNYALYPHMTAYENMAFGLRLRGFPRAEIDRRVREAAGILGLEPHLDRKPGALSGGQRQRVAVGRAIVRKPKLFLLDEPLSNLDARLRVQMRGELSRLHRRLGVTMIYVTHDQTEAMTMGDRIILMKDGFVQQVDTPLHIYRSPVNKFVASFMGSPSMNFLPGTIRGKKHLHFVGDEEGIRFRLPAKVFKKLRSHLNKRVIVGIRPEDLALKAGGKRVAPNTVRASVDVMEPLGSETYVTCSRKGSVLIARIAASEELKAGGSVDLVFDLSKAHYFDSATERALT